MIRCKAELIHLDLFSGIGGIALAARWAGFSTRLFCEIDPYCRRVLAKHWPGVPCHDDVRTLDRSALEAAGIEEVALLTGGFPCQPFSSAGKRKGQSDDRFLWPAMLDVIRLTRPAWVVGENVAGFVRLGLDRMLADLEAEGYTCRAFMVPACAVGAPHQRQRCFVVGHADGRGSEAFRAVPARNGAQPGRVRRDVPNPRGLRCDAGRSGQPLQGPGLAGECFARQPSADAYDQCRQSFAAACGERLGEGPSGYPATYCPALPDAMQQRPAAKRDVQPQSDCGWTSDRPAYGDPWQVEPAVDRMVNGLSPGLGRRLTGLGNAVVPQQIYPILAGIADLAWQEVPA